jgi:predicted O-methyltransferase YrrM
MSLKSLIERLKYPHKFSAIPYFLQNPGLLLGIPREPMKLHVSQSIEQAMSANIIEALHYFLPQKFLDHLEQHKLLEQESFRLGYQLLLYLLVRKYKPDVFVETGVARGVSSAYILCAMKENGKGHLYSIDLPAKLASADSNQLIDKQIYQLADGQIHHNYEVGYFVPEYLKDSWTLILGDARQELPQLLDKLGKVDIFLHDSLHTYDHMMFEYQTAYPHIVEGGLLLSDDVLWNRAFYDFCKKQGKKPIIYRTFGILSK